MPARPNRRQRESKRLNAATESETLDALLARLAIPDDQWDFILIGDGSGSNFNRACGWGTVSIERLTGERKIWYGSMNLGTVNIAEMMAYIQPLSWLTSRERTRRAEGGDYRAFHIYIITDSQYVADSIKTANRVAKMNASLWTAFDSFAREGFILVPKHLPRNDVALNNYVDLISKAARKNLEAYNIAEAAGVPENMYDVNPSVD